MYTVHLDPKITLETCTDQNKQLKSASIYFRKLLYCHSILYYMSHASCTQKLVFSLKAHLHLQMCAYLVTSILRWNVALFYCLFVCKSSRILNTCIHAPGFAPAWRSPASKRPFFQTRLLHLHVFQTRQLGARCILLRPVVKYCGSVGVRHIAVSFKMEAFVKVSHFSCAATASSFQRHFDF